MYKLPVLLIVAILILCPVSAAQAQTATPPPTPTPAPDSSTPSPATGPTYIIQSGDSLYDIAIRFGISLADLLAANPLNDPNNITAGTQLVIPGLPGITGVLTTQTISYGDSLISVGRSNQIPIDLLQRLNHVTSPEELYAGDSLVVPQKDASAPLANRLALSSGETTLEAAVKNQTDPWTLSAINNLQGTWGALPGDVLFAPGASAGSSGAANQPPVNGLPSAFISVAVKPLPVIQGGTAVIIVQTQPGVQLSGLLVDKPLHFFPLDAASGKMVALQGLYALLEPGPYPLALTASLPDGTKQTYQQMLIVKDGNYPTDPLLSVSSETLDPATNDAEIKKLEQITAPSTNTQAWQGIFKNPSAYTDCFTSRFGVRRDYVGQGSGATYHSFHAGLDFCGGLGLPITAAADGTVIFADLLDVHGNTTIIDHGWGIYSMYAHQSEIDVKAGQQVHAGDKIGNVGGTGRVTGPHLHFEIWVNGVEVQPMDWLLNVYP